MKGRALATLALALALTMTGGVSADILIEKEIIYDWKRGEEVGYSARHSLWIGETRARLQQENEVYLVDTVAGEFHYVDLDRRHFARYASPNTFEQDIPESLLDRVRAEWEKKMPRTVEVRRTGETGEIAGYRAERVLIDAGGPGEPVEAHFDLWVSPELGELLEGTTYWSLERDRLMTTPYTEWLLEPLRELGAYPVKSDVSFMLSGGRMRTEFTLTLVSVAEDVEVADGIYEVPDGFTPFPEPGSVTQD